MRSAIALSTRRLFFFVPICESNDDYHDDWRFRVILNPSFLCFQTEKAAVTPARRRRTRSRTWRPARPPQRRRPRNVQQQRTPPPRPLPRARRRLPFPRNLSPVVDIKKETELVRSTLSGEWVNEEGVRWSEEYPQRRPTRRTEPMSMRRRRRLLHHHLTHHSVIWYCRLEEGCVKKKDWDLRDVKITEASWKFVWLRKKWDGGWCFLTLPCTFPFAAAVWLL